MQSQCIECYVPKKIGEGQVNKQEEIEKEKQEEIQKIKQANQLIEQTPKYRSYLMKNFLERCKYNFDNQNDIFITSESANFILTNQVYDQVQNTVVDCSAYFINVKIFNYLNSRKELARKCFNQRQSELSKNFEIYFPKIETQSLTPLQKWISSFFKVIVPLVTLIFFILNAVVLVPTKTSFIFYSYLEMISVGYLSNFNQVLQQHGQWVFLSEIYSAFKFLDFDFNPIQGTRTLLYYINNSNENLKIVADESLYVLTPDQFLSFQRDYEIFFRNKKICFFAYDAGSLIDILLVLILLTILSNLIYFICITVRSNRKGTILMYLNSVRQEFAGRIFKRFFNEAYILFTFFYFNQVLYLTVEEDIGLRPEILVTKVIAQIFLYLVVLGLPIQRIYRDLCQKDYLIDTSSDIDIETRYSIQRMIKRQAIIEKMTAIRKLTFAISNVPLINQQSSILMMVIMFTELYIAIKLMEGSLGELKILWYQRMFKSMIFILFAFSKILLRTLRQITSLEQNIEEFDKESNKTNDQLYSYWVISGFFIVAFIDFYCIMKIALGQVTRIKAYFNSGYSSPENVMEDQMIVAESKEFKQNTVDFWDLEVY